MERRVSVYQRNFTKQSIPRIPNAPHILVSHVTVSVVNVVSRHDFVYFFAELFGQV